MTPTAIVAYLALFATVGFVFVFASLLLGRVVRSRTPTPLKHEIYECGEPAVGPGFVQFDLRFYVVALVFLIFEVEVALFFPTATVFGKASQLRAPGFPMKTLSADVQLSPELVKKYQELEVPSAAMPSPANANVSGEVATQANTLALASMLDLGVFFAVLLVGFAYVWRRGDLDWVRATRHPTTTAETAAAVMKLRGDR
jgi:NADH-quinone oxidoreductase subunit A